MLYYRYLEILTLHFSYHIVTISPLTGSDDSVGVVVSEHKAYMDLLFLRTGGDEHLHSYFVGSPPGNHSE